MGASVLQSMTTLTLCRSGLLLLQMAVYTWSAMVETAVFQLVPHSAVVDDEVLQRAMN